MRFPSPDISSKEAYLSWVARWKEAYKALAHDIREAKRAKKHHRDRAREHADLREDEHQKMWDAHYLRMRLRPQARYMIDLRHEGKERSWQKRCEEIQARIDEKSITAA